MSFLEDAQLTGETQHAGMFNSQLWIVYRILPDEARPLPRSAWLSLPAAERARELEEYRVRDLEGYEDCKHTIVEYEIIKLVEEIDDA